MESFDPAAAVANGVMVTASIRPGPLIACAAGSKIDPCHEPASVEPLEALE
jgi:hypothetical protein